jgi:hypothetical protein
MLNSFTSLHAGAAFDHRYKPHPALSLCYVCAFCLRVGEQMISRACAVGLQRKEGTAGGQHDGDDDVRWLRLLRAFLRAQGGMPLAQAFMAVVLFKLLA